MRMRYIIILVLMLFLVLEAVSRIQLLRMFDRRFVWNPTATYLRYGHLASEAEGVRSMVFGGSTVCPDTLRFNYQGEQIVTYFCDPCQAMPQPCFNVASPALTIVDSWYLYRDFAESNSLETVFFLNGVNDARPNNIKKKDFDDWYRHIQFYDEAYILYHHPEQVVTWIPTLLHMIYQHQRGIDYLPKENFQNFDENQRRRFLDHGNSIKSDTTYYNCLSLILAKANTSGHKVIMGTFPYYQPSNYTISLFNQKKLDYKESLFPTELYGKPTDVVAAIEIHNSLTRLAISKNPSAILLDFAYLIPKEGKQFNDICHLSPTGCSLMLNQLEAILE